jgi:hypothetical protein
VADAIRPPGEHTKLLLSAARDVLVPLGLVRLGRSRLWVDDRGWWAVVVEFQPSGFAKGSFLNVGAMWLWYAKDSWSFDVGHRVEPFTEFESVEQFKPVAEQLAGQAARKVREYREAFSSIHEVAKYLAGEASKSVWGGYNAAISAGLAGDLAKATRFFAGLADYPATHEWENEAQGRAAVLAKHLPNLAAFRAAVTRIVDHSRELHKLPKVDDLSFA